MNIRVLVFLGVILLLSVANGSKTRKHRIHKSRGKNASHMKKIGPHSRKDGWKVKPKSNNYISAKKNDNKDQGFMSKVLNSAGPSALTSIRHRKLDNRDNFDSEDTWMDTILVEHEYKSKPKPKPKPEPLYKPCGEEIRPELLSSEWEFPSTRPLEYYYGEDNYEEDDDVFSGTDFHSTNFRYSTDGYYSQYGDDDIDYAEGDAADEEDEEFLLIKIEPSTDHSDQEPVGYFQGWIRKLIDATYPSLSSSSEGQSDKHTARVLEELPPHRGPHHFKPIDGNDENATDDTEETDDGSSSGTSSYGAATSSNSTEIAVTGTDPTWWDGASQPIAYSALGLVSILLVAGILLSWRAWRNKMDIPPTVVADNGEDDDHNEETNAGVIDGNMNDSLDNKNKDASNLDDLEAGGNVGSNGSDSMEYFSAAIDEPRDSEHMANDDHDGTSRCSPVDATTPFMASTTMIKIQNAFSSVSSFFTHSWSSSTESSSTASVVSEYEAVEENEHESHLEIEMSDLEADDHYTAPPGEDQKMKSDYYSPGSDLYASATSMPPYSTSAGHHVFTPGRVTVSDNVSAMVNAWSASKQHQQPEHEASPEGVRTKRSSFESGVTTNSAHDSTSDDDDLSNDTPKLATNATRMKMFTESCMPVGAQACLVSNELSPDNKGPPLQRSSSTDSRRRMTTSWDTNEEENINDMIIGDYSSPVEIQ